MKLNIKHTLVALLATSLMLTSCLEDQDEEYKVVGGSSDSDTIEILHQPLLI